MLHPAAPHTARELPVFDLASSDEQLDEATCDALAECMRRTGCLLVSKHDHSSALAQNLSAVDPMPCCSGCHGLLPRLVVEHVTQLQPGVQPWSTALSWPVVNVTHKRRSRTRWCPRS